MRGLLVASIVVLAGAVCGCQVYDPALVNSRASRRPPPRPPESTEGPDTGEIVVGLHRVVLDPPGSEWREIGFDLDHVTTVGPDFPTACTPRGSGTPQIDGVDGIDNVFGSDFYTLVSAATSDLEANARATQEVGNGALMLRVIGWNGTPNDPHVTVHVLQSFYAAPGAAGDAMPPPPPADPSASAARWDGNDWFWVRADGLAGGDIDAPLVSDDLAYVSGGTVVASIPDRVDVFFVTGMYTVRVRLSDALAAGLAPVEGEADLPGVVTIAGRWSITDLLETARNIDVCPEDREYGLLRGQLDELADVRSRPETDNMGQPCDAISVGTTFVATRVRLAGIATAPSPIDYCALRPTGDGGVPDGSVPETDGGAVDAGGGIDGGPRDAGPPDASARDAGIDASPDGGG